MSIKVNKRAATDTAEEAPAKKLKQKRNKQTFAKKKNLNNIKIKNSLEPNNGKEQTATDTAEEAPVKKVIPKVNKQPFTKKENPNNVKNKKSFKQNNGKEQGKFKKPFNSKGDKKQDEFTKPEDWKKFKAEKRELMLKRKQATRGSYDVILEIMKIYEKMRPNTVTEGDKKKYILDIHKLMKKDNNYVKFALSHDTARVIETMFRQATPEMRIAMTQEILPGAAQLMQSKFGKHVIHGILLHGSAKSKQELVKAMYGNVIRLLRHGIASSIVEQAYTKSATKIDKINLRQEFYGSMYKKSKDLDIKCLKDVYTKSPDMKEATLSATKANILRVLNKKLVDSTLLHTVINDYFGECTAENKTELIGHIAPHSVIVSNTKDGAKVVMECIWLGTNKDRKGIIKSFKEHAVEMSKHDYGYTAIITLLDSYDDTVLLNKIIIQQLLDKAEELLANANGRKILTWLAAPGDPRYFHPTFLKELEEGKLKSTARKETHLRRNEILQYSNDKILQRIALAPKTWFGSASKAFLSTILIQNGSGEALKSALESLCEVLCDLEWTFEEDGKKKGGPALEDAGLHMSLKKIIKNDKEKAEKGEATFGMALIDKLTSEILATWLQFNRGCYLLAEIYESSSDDLKQQYKTIIMNLQKLLNKQTTTGAKVLLEKLQN